MLKEYEESKFVDCRVNAYPSYTEYKGIQRYPPNFIFADLDLSLIRTEQVTRKDIIRNIEVFQIQTKWISHCTLDWKWLSHLPTNRCASIGTVFSI